MALNCLEFGDKESADVKLQLVYADGSEYDGNPLYLHSQLLKENSKFFQAWLSERWCPGESLLSLDLTVNNNNKAETYVKCIQHLYAPKDKRHDFFSNISLTLDILSVADELLIKDVTEACMEYLEAVPWTVDETLQVRKMITDLQINPVMPDLSARLFNSQSDNLNIVKTELCRLLSMVAQNRDADFLNLARSHIMVNFKEGSSQQLRDVTKMILLQEVKKTMNLFASLSGKELNELVSHLLWVVQIMRVVGIADYVEIVADALVAVYGRLEEGNELKTQFLTWTEIAVEQLVNVTTATHSFQLAGSIIVSRSVRLKLLLNCVPVIESLGNQEVEGKPNKWLANLSKLLSTAIGTLPLSDQNEICGRMTLKSPKSDIVGACNSWFQRLRRGCHCSHFPQD